MQSLRNTLLFRAAANPFVRRGLRAFRTVALGGTLAYAGYGTGVHDALNDPEGTTEKILGHVLTSSGGGKLLPTTHPDARLVQRLGDELIAAAQSSLEAEEADIVAAAAQRAEPTADEKAAVERVHEQQRTLRRPWRFVVIDDKTINAFVTDQLPGYVFCHRGLLDLMKRSPERLSFILGHELAHHLCDHNQQTRNLSAGLSVLQLVVYAAVDPTGILAFAMELGVASTLASYTLQLPSSRGHETEADALGLQLVVRACRNPKEAIKAHEVLAKYELKHGGAPDVTSLGATHPATLVRLKELEAQLPQAIDEYKKGGCYYRKEAWKRLSSTDRLASAREADVHKDRASKETKDNVATA